MAESTAQIESGIVAGTLTGEVVRYLGIPYAAAPFGSRRFQPPQPPEPWSGVRRAGAFGATAPQSAYSGAIGELLPSLSIPGDDILTVNVWSPADAAGAPVLLWFHGGALERGTAALPLYDGAVFARAGIVFVSANYRLGAEGFSVFEDAPRNLGLADAGAALAWTHRNVAAFGGDPARITVFGESAGGAIVAGLLAQRHPRELVAGAIIQSGPLDAESPERAARVTHAVAKHLGIAPTAAAFRGIAPERLVRARDELAAGATLLRPAPGYMIALDPDTLPVSPRTALRDAAVPLIIGTNTDEYRLWYTPDKLAKMSRVTFGILALAQRLPRGLWRAYRDAWPDASAGELVGQVVTDRILRVPATELARHRTSPTYVYEFAWPSPVRDLRAAHALELGFVFDALEEPAAITMAGADAPADLARGMNDDWVRFAQTGAPGWAAFRDGERVRRYDAPTIEVALPRSDALAVLAG